MISKELLDIIACPICKKGVREANEYLICQQCNKKYPVKNDIPIMLIDEAEEIE